MSPGPAVANCPSDPFKRRPSNCLIVLYVCAITRDICCIFIVFFFPVAVLGLLSCVFSFFHDQFAAALDSFSPPGVSSAFPLPFCLWTWLPVFWTNSSLWGVGASNLVSNWTSLIRTCSQRIWKWRCCCYAAPYSCGGPHGIWWFQPDKCDY